MWTYTGDPTSSSKDAVRFLIGDTVEDDPQLQDGEILFALTAMSANIYMAAAQCCDSIAARLSREETYGADGVNIGAEAMKAYQDRACNLRIQATRNAIAIPYVGGVSVSDKIITDADGDFDQPPLGERMHDNAWAGNQDIPSGPGRDPYDPNYPYPGLY